MVFGWDRRTSDVWDCVLSAFVLLLQKNILKTCILGFRETVTKYVTFYLVMQ